MSKEKVKIAHSVPGAARKAIRKQAVNTRPQPTDVCGRK